MGCIQEPIDFDTLDEDEYENFIDYIVENKYVFKQTRYLIYDDDFNFEEVQAPEEYLQINEETGWEVQYNGGPPMFYHEDKFYRFEDIYYNLKPTKEDWLNHNVELFKQHNPNVIEEDIDHFITMWKRAYD